MSDVIAFFTNVRTCFDIGVVAAKSGVVFVGVVFVAASSRGDGGDASALDANVRCVVARSMRDACSTGEKMGALARGDAVVDGKSARFARVGARRDDPSSSDFDIFLGVVPHQIRGSVAGFTQTLFDAPCFPRCTACSTAVVAKYRDDRDGFLTAVFDDPKTLEDATGLTDLLGAVDADDAEWLDDDSDDAFDV